MPLSWDFTAYKFVSFGGVDQCQPEQGRNKARAAAPYALNAASLSPVAGCQPVPVSFGLRPGWCPVSKAELL